MTAEDAFYFLKIQAGYREGYFRRNTFPRRIVNRRNDSTWKENVSFCNNEEYTRRYINCPRCNKLENDLALSLFWLDNKTRKPAINLTRMQFRNKSNAPSCWL